MNNLFKVGDKVRCIDNFGRERDIKLNEFYIITNISGNRLTLDKTHIEHKFFMTRFEPIHIQQFKDKLEELLNEEN